MKNLYIFLIAFGLIALPSLMSAQVSVNTSNELVIPKSGVALRVGGTEALWSNASYYSWGYGKDWNYFADEILIGSSGGAPYTPSTGSGLTISNSRDIRLEGTGSKYLYFYNSTTQTGRIGVSGSHMYMYNQMADGNIYFGTEGSVKQTITDDGKVGIGTTAPASGAKLHTVGGDIRMDDTYPFLQLNSTATGNQGIQFMEGGASAAWFWHDRSNDLLRFDNSSASSRPDLIITSAGSIGMGTTTPSSELEINSASPEITLAGSGRRAIDFNDGTSDVALLSMIGTTLYLNNYSGGNLWMGASDEMHLMPSGNMGIGTTSPQASVHLVKANDPSFRLNESGSAASYLEFSNLNANTAKFVKVNTAGSALIDYDPTPLDGTSASRFRFFRTTNTSGQVTLEILRGNNTSQPNARISGNGNSYLNSQAGNVGIGTVSPSNLLHVDGVACKPGGGVWTAASDRRVKQNIKEFTDGLEEVLQINPVTFEYNGKGGTLDDGSEYVGVIAQEIQEVAPYTVEEFVYEEVIAQGEDENYIERTGKKETYLQYDGTAITYMLVNSIKELAAENDEKDERIDELESQVQAMQDAIAKIQAQLSNVPVSTDTQDREIEKDVTLNGEGNVAELAQNTPNPFDENTVIKYFLPEGTTGAHMNIFSAEGKVLKTVKIEEAGQGQINLKANSLPSGSYMYQLVTDAGVVGTKTMILAQ